MTNSKKWLLQEKNFPCRSCDLGIMKWPNEIKQVIVTETQQSLKDNQHYKNGIVYRYSTNMMSAHLICDNCGDVMLAAYIRNDDNSDDNSYSKVLFLNPAPMIITLPSSCTGAVREPIEQSFALYWVDLNSCANKIRIALEALMDHEKIPEKKVNGEYISLGTRLNTYKETHPKLANFLTAIKWIGNASSHQAGTTQQAVWDAYDLLEYALDQVFPDRENHLQQISDRVNANKGY